MARHSKVFNALMSFYKKDVDSYFSDLIESKKSFEDEFDVEKRRKKQEEYDILKSRIVFSFESIIELAKDQAEHFNEEKMIKDWECEMIVADISVYCDKKLKILKTKKVIGPSQSIFTSCDFMTKDDKLFEVDMIMEDVNKFQI